MVPVLLREGSLCYIPDISTLFDDASSSTRSRLTQAKLTAVVNALEWLEVARAWEVFDALNVGAVVPEREATRFVSCSQAGAGAHLVRLPDLSLRGSVVASVDFLTICQRRLGLYISPLVELYDTVALRGAAASRSTSSSATPPSTTPTRPTATIAAI